MARSDSTGRDLQQQEVAAQQRLASAVQDEGSPRQTAISGIFLSYINADGITTPATAATPFPVFIGDGEDTLSVLGDGGTVVRLIAGKVGTTKGIAIFGADAGNVARLLLTDADGRSQTTDFQLHDLLRELLAQQMITNAHLALMTDAEIDPEEMEMDL